MDEQREMTEAELASVTHIASGILTPNTMTTYRRADGELMDEEFGWTTDLECTADNLERPLALVEERWQRTTFRTFWLLPEPCGSCEMEDMTGEECDEDAAAWWRDPEGKWHLTCAPHDPGDVEVITCQG